MITYDTKHLADKFLSDVDYRAQTPSGRSKQAQTGLCTGLKGLGLASWRLAPRRCVFTDWGL